MMTIQLDTLQLSDFATSGWVFEELIDWFGLTAGRAPDEERAREHGSFPVAEVWRSSRAISFKAHYLGTRSADVEAAYEEISAIGGEAPVRMAVATDRGTTFRIVTVEGVRALDNRDYAEGTVNVDVLARDPRRYAEGTWVTTPAATSGVGLVWPAVSPWKWPGGGVAGRLTIENRGLTPSPAEFRLRGGFDSALITCAEDGTRMGFSRPVAPGDFVLIDVRHGRALLNGNPDFDLARWLQFYELGWVPKKSQRTYQLDVVNSVGASLEGKVDSAWL